MLKLFTICFYYLNDFSEKTYYYEVCAYSEKQARYYLGKHLNCCFANSLNQGYAMRHKGNINVSVIVSIDVNDIYDNTSFKGEITSL